MSALELRPGLADVPCAESAISFIDGKRARLEYRGMAVETLARESCFEETAWLLLKGELPTQRELADFDDQLRHHRRIKYKLKDLIKCLPETGHPMDALQASVAAMGMFYPALARRRRHQQEEDHGLRAPGLQGQGPTGDGPSGVRRTRLLGDRPAQVVRNGRGAGARRSRHPWAEGDLSERGLLLGNHLSIL